MMRKERVSDMKARLKFSKVGSMRFIGHLDVMRYFQKAFRRAEIEVSYSKGFSPHQLMSFASPLGIGLSSDAEYLDVTLEKSDSPEKMTERINAVMNDEIAVKDFTILDDDAKPSMAMLSACDYMICIKPDKDNPLTDDAFAEEAVRKIKEAEKIEILKKTKRSEKIVDIKPNIYHIETYIAAFCDDTKNEYGRLEIDTSFYKPVIYCQLTAGSVVNIKPELVLEAVMQMNGFEYNPLDYQIHRLEMYADETAKKGEVHLLGSEIPCKLVPLSEFGKQEMA